MLRAIFFGNQMEILDELKRHTHIVGVFYQPPRLSNWKIPDLLLRHAGLRNRLRPILRHAFFRDRWRQTLQKFILYDYCKKNGLAVLTTGSIHADDFAQSLVRLQADLGVVVNFSQILPDRLLAATRYGFINFHPSALPKYRGPTPFEHILLNKDAESAVTWHRMIAQVDAGPILCQERFSIVDVDTMTDLRHRSIELGRQMLGPLLQSIEDRCARETPQDDAQATCFPKRPRKEKEALARDLEQKAPKKR